MIRIKLNTNKSSEKKKRKNTKLLVREMLKNELIQEYF